jgi:hypothetical protein
MVTNVPDFDVPAPMPLTVIQKKATGHGGLNPLPALPKRPRQGF